MSFEIEQRKPWTGDALLLLIGPGGAGKSTVGSLLTPLLGRHLVDLDHRYTERFGDIGRYINERGYDAYRVANSQLASETMAQLDGPSILVLSSGFLSPDNRPEVLTANKAVVASGYSVGLLPSLDVAQATRIIVGRQVSRGHALNAGREADKFRSRFTAYRSAGDMLVVSVAAPLQIAQAIADRCA